MYYYNHHSHVKKTTIQVEKKTVKRLAEFGNFHSTYDAILNNVLDHVENCRLAKIRMD